MNSTFAKRIEVRKFSELACSIKYLIRQASNTVSMQQQQQLMQQQQKQKRLIRQKHTFEPITNMPIEKDVSTNSKFDERIQSTAQSINSKNYYNETTHKRALHTETERVRKAQSNFRNLDIDYNKDPNEKGPCKRSFQMKTQNYKSHEGGCRMGGCGGNTSNRSQQPRMRQSDGGVGADRGHSIKFERRDFGRTNYRNEVEETRFQQSLSLLADQSIKNSARRGSLSFRMKPRNSDRNLALNLRKSQMNDRPTEKELQEARYGQTLITLAEKKLMDSSNYYKGEKIYRFPIEDEIEARAKLAEADKNSPEKRAAEIKIAELTLKKPRQAIRLPTVSFGRRKNESKIEDKTNKKAIANCQTPTPTSLSGNFVVPEDNIYRHLLRDSMEETVETVTPRLDEIHYRESDNLGKKYSQTWADYPDINQNRKPVMIDLVPPPFEKRPKNERPVTARAWGGVDEKSLIC